MAEPTPFSITLLLLFNALYAIFPVAATPFGMTWSTKSFGPDGPWQAVRVSIGSPGQTIALYPGGSFRSHLLTSKICSNATLSPGVCFASSGGIYTPSNSSTSFDTIIRFPATTDYTHGGLEVQGSAAIGALDQISIGFSTKSQREVIVPNVTLAIHDDVNLVYPGGSTPVLELGTLGLGFLGTVNQSFQQTNAPNINGSLIPGYLQAQGITNSNSFGLHIGSVEPRISASLYFGGYDQGRIVGAVTTQQGAIAGIEGQDAGAVGLIDLLDIELNVVEGASPWNSTNVASLLGSGNSSIGPALSVVMLPEAPYLDLPQSTCDAIASWLPVTYQSSLGLYTWNVKDPQYERIVSSPSVLTFVFRKDQINTANVTINVPFMLLNLTLEAPLTSTPTPYFPCNAQSYGRYSLGRAFLQAAFIGTNWNANDNQGVWWLAQAPGPNIGSQSNVQDIQDQDVNISSSANSWSTSWEDSWTPLSIVSGNATTSLPGSTNSTSNGSNIRAIGGGLSVGSKAGIGVGVAIGALVALALGVWLFAYRRNPLRKPATSRGFTTSGDVSHLNNAHCLSTDSPGFLPSETHRSGGYGPAELMDNAMKPVHELSSD
ncbi:hypothetical protein D0Z07_0353 [Hyphodiscus hymeniophilus]|uniref:Peptidase A1 domain-containing protein n=1 Tax=Hyphodiscus hymeniophilus TaxID=353542 RepID=A0A9P6VRS8_9HELO|nr:hypothetical protein D0Z07_0353 [Hyphodiscus hymeniophilus]